MTADFSYSLEALESQWRATRAPKLGLELAEEHRRRDDLPTAIEVLEAGLEVHPDHMSSRVALSRYLVDSGRFEDALGHLEQIVGVDPVHLVANKLLVRTHIGLGRLEDARDKLDIYEMLGEGDADIEALRAAVSGGVIEGAAVPPPEPTAQETGEAASETPLESSFDDEVPDAEPVSVPSPGSADEPFGSVWSSDASAGYWDEVGGEGIFAVEYSSEAATADAVEDTSPRPSASGPADPGEAPRESPPESSVTLGNLYLEQGHTQKAAESYREVLEREPDNQAARRSLASIEEQVVEGATATERKKSVLIAYRARLRRALETQA
ncbi:MAG: tetratricopeptide repeat protein [Thermoanaerobaculia bacterium]